jgi:hypothetical protein
VQAVVLLVGLLARPTRLAALGFALVLLAYAALYGFWKCWYLGGGMGHRSFVDVAPLAVPVFALALTALGNRLQRGARAGLATCVTLLVMLTCWRGKYPMEHATSRDYCDTITLSLSKQWRRLRDGRPTHATGRPAAQPERAGP